MRGCHQSVISRGDLPSAGPRSSAHTASLNLADSCAVTSDAGHLSVPCLPKLVRRSRGAGSSRSAHSEHSMDRCGRWLVMARIEQSSLWQPAQARWIFPMDAFRDLADRVLSRGAHAALGLGPTEGQPKLRRAIAARIGVRPEQVLVVNGAQQGLDLVARCLLDPGDTVVMDRPGYVGAIQVFRAAGANIVGWDIERADPNELEDLLLRYRPKLLYTNPTFHNPTGRTLDLHERHDLLDLAVRYRLPVVEDDLYRDTWFETPPPPSLRQLDQHQLVIQVSTFSKTIAGGMRLGFLAAADAIVDQLALVKQRIDVASPSFEQLIVAEFVSSAGYDEHLSTLRVAHRGDTRRCWRPFGTTCRQVRSALHRSTVGCTCGVASVMKSTPEN